MKKILTYILSAAVLVSLTVSCDKILDTESPSAFDSATVFSNYSLTEGTIFGITEAFCEVNSYRGRFLPWYGFNTDVEWYNTYKPGDGKSDIAAYDCLPNNSQLNLSNGPFPLMYMGIERANLVIEGLREYGKVDEKADMAYLLGEALTLRAMIYYDLTKALAAGAFALTGKTNIAQNLLPVMEEGKMMSDYYTSFGSRTRDLAFYTYVQMLCDVDQATVQNNINTVCRMISGDRWMDTQSTAFSLFVLGKYAEKMNVANSHLSASVKVNGEERTLNSNMASVGYAFVPKVGSNAVEIKNNGDQKMIANIFTKTSVAEYDMNEGGNLIKMAVNYYDKSGAPANLAALNAGTDLRVQITVQNPSEWKVTELALSYYLPSGWELVNDRLMGDMTGNEGAKHLDLRDDRAYFYFDLYPGDKKTFTLKVNATYEGNYMIPAIRCEDMYNDEIYYQIPARGCVVK
jgi:hypothetical protein